MISLAGYGIQHHSYTVMKTHFNCQNGEEYNERKLQNILIRYKIEILMKREYCFREMDALAGW